MSLEAALTNKMNKDSKKFKINPSIVVGPVLRLKEVDEEGRCSVGCPGSKKTSRMSACENAGKRLWLRMLIIILILTVMHLVI